MYLIKDYKKLYNKTNILKIYYNLKFYPFIIFINQDQLKMLNLLNLKNEISKLEGKSFIMNLKYIKKLFNYESFKFMSINTLAIVLKNINDFFLFIINLLDNIIFYYTYNKFLSFINIKNNVFEHKLNINLLVLNLALFKLILNIIILLLYLLYTFVNFLNIKN